MVWGCFSGQGLGQLVVLPKNLRMNADYYLELSSDYLPDSFELCSAEVLQQDSAPAHTAKLVLQWLRDCEVPFISDWPGNSPDINPIENLWGIMKKALQGKDVSSVPRLEAAIHESWDNILADTIRNLALSLPS